jgi:hypothetical protein
MEGAKQGVDQLLLINYCFVKEDGSFDDARSKLTRQTRSGAGKAGAVRLKRKFVNTLRQNLTKLVATGGKCGHKFYSFWFC